MFALYDVTKKIQPNLIFFVTSFLLLQTINKIYFNLNFQYNFYTKYFYNLNLIKSNPHCYHCLLQSTDIKQKSRTSVIETADYPMNLRSHSTGT